MKIVTEFDGTTTKDGKEIDLTSQAKDNSKWALVKPASYLAVIDQVVAKTYRAKWGKVKSPEADGLWEYLKLIPDITLVNDVGTQINRQEFTVGVVYQNKLFRPEGEGLPVFGGLGGALFFLQALQMFERLDGGKWRLELDLDAMKGRVLKVRTGIGGYIKGKTSFTPDELVKELGSFTFDDYQAKLDTYNANLEGDQPLRLKNYIIGFYTPNRDEVEEAGFFMDEKGRAWVVEPSEGEAGDDW